MSEASRAIVCVASHVARGTVGNRAAAFAAEALGHPVWSVPTVLLPWHPGQGPGTRMVWPSADFAALLGDLASAPQRAEVGGMLSGYLGEAAQAEPIASLAEALREEGALYCCDPVMGGARGLYVAEVLAEAIRERLLPVADIATPNRHELEWLARRPLPDNESLVAAARSLGPERVLVTSIHAPPGRTGNLLVAPEGTWLIEHERIAAPNSGTGDLTASLFLSGLVEGMGDAAALERATSAVLGVMRKTASDGADELPLERARPLLDRPNEDVRAVAFAPRLIRGGVGIAGGP